MSVIVDTTPDPVVIEASKRNINKKCNILPEIDEAEKEVELNVREAFP